jgi:hypothetical protein
VISVIGKTRANDFRLASDRRLIYSTIVQFIK